MTAPQGWAWALFPLEEGDRETLRTETVVRRGMALVKEAERSGDYAPIGPVIHWAHIFKSEQGIDGDWPAAVNARTGEAINAARTASPAKLMARLDALLESTEYAACIEAAAHTILQGESDGTRGTDHCTGH